MKTRTQARSWYSARSWIGGLLLALAAVGGPGCKNPDAILIRATADEALEQVAIYVRDDATRTIVFDSGWTPVTRAGEDPRDITKNALKVALKLSQKGNFTLLMVGVIGAVDGVKPAVGAKQFFWAGRVKVTGTEEIRAHLYSVPAGQDADRDLWPSAATWLAAVPAAAAEFAKEMDLLDCYDAAADQPKPANNNKTVDPAKINPFATEICGDGVDEACNGDVDEMCVDADGDGDPSGTDCNDADPTRHHPTATDPFPDPPNCCGYSLGFAKGTADGNKSYLNDPTICPSVRCGDSIDNACKGIENNVSNDTKCIIDADCDGVSPPMDCDDNDPLTYPGAPEPCGGDKDLNCSGKANDGCVPCDLDGDGFQRNDVTNGCPNSDDKNPGKFDCNDYDSSVFPESTTVTLPTRSQGLGGSEGGGSSATQHIESARRGYCRRYYEVNISLGTPRVGSFAQLPGDFDCDGAAYNACPTVACDADGDGFPTDGPGCPVAGIPKDCNDNDPTIFPGAPDKCGDGISQDCFMDKACSGDTDGDGYTGADDCAEGDATRHPFATEVCNGLDDDCDGLVDEGNPDTTGKALVESSKVTGCTDSNIGECGKTIGTCVCSAATPNAIKDPNGMSDACPTELTATGSNKDKCFAAGQPKPQSCNPLDPKDDDCDGRVDAPDGKNLPTVGQSCGSDVGECKTGTITGCNMALTNCFSSLAVNPTNAWLTCSNDAICPITEVCNGKDDDCDGALPTNEADQDGDTYMACSGCSDVSTLAAGLVGCGDCVDTGSQAGSMGAVAAAAINPAALDACDGVDNNCNVATVDDEGATCPAGATGGAAGHPACCQNPSGFSCRDLNANKDNCNGCGNVCSLTRADRCVAGGCVCGDAGLTCSGVPCSGVQCSASDLCTNVTGDIRCRKPQGATCTAGSECQSANCVDGFCCESACTGQCERCNATPGTCTQTTGAPITGGTPARSACTGTAGDKCDGTCSSSRVACTYPATPTAGGTACPAASCSTQGASSQNKAVTTCNSAGDCSAQTTTNCASPSCAAGGTDPFQTTTTTCTGSACTPTNSQCGDFRCNGGVSGATTGTGCLASCDEDADCVKAARPYCSLGLCVAKRPAGAVCSSSAECSLQCSGHCCTSLCVPNACTSGAAYPQACDNTGACVASGASVSCGNYKCNAGATACQSGSCSCTSGSPAPCDDTSKCASFAYCESTCFDKKSNGGACTPSTTDGGQCESGFCQDNTCCNVSSCGPCGNCATGTCTAIADNLPAQDGSCGNYLCNGSSFNCPAAGSCSTDADCISAAYCNGSGNCTTRTAAGLECSGPSSTQCAVGAATCAGPALDGKYYCCAAACPVTIVCDTDLTDVDTSQSCITTGLCHTISFVAATPGDCVTGDYCSTGQADGCATDLVAGTACTQNAQCSTSSTCRTNCCTSAAACSDPCATGQCSGTGSCAAKADGDAPGGAGCGLFLCGGSTTCPTTCATDVDCALGSYCAADNSCHTEKAASVACSAADDNCKVAGCRTCVGDRICPISGICECRNDSPDCTAGNYCKEDASGDLCAAQITSTAACADANCGNGSTSCLQCAGAVECPGTGAGTCP